MHPDPLLTYTEAAVLLRCSERQVYRLIAAGKLAAHHRRIHRSTLDDFLARHGRTAFDTIPDDRKETG